MPRWLLIAAALFALAVGFGPLLGRFDARSAYNDVPTAAATATPTLGPSATPTPTGTITPMPTATRTATPTFTLTATPAPSPTGDIKITYHNEVQNLVYVGEPVRIELLGYNRELVVGWNFGPGEDALKWMADLRTWVEWKPAKTGNVLITASVTIDGKLIELDHESVTVLEKQEPVMAPETRRVDVTAWSWTADGMSAGQLATFEVSVYRKGEDSPFLVQSDGYPIEGRIRQFQVPVPGEYTFRVAADGHNVASKTVPIDQEDRGEHRGPVPVPVELIRLPTATPTMTHAPTATPMPTAHVHLVSPWHGQHFDKVAVDLVWEGNAHLLGENHIYRIYAAAPEKDLLDVRTYGTSWEGWWPIRGGNYNWQVQIIRVRDGVVVAETEWRWFKYTAPLSVDTGTKRNPEPVLNPTDPW